MDSAMPMLIINMGGEMVYILEQRLHAQTVSADKSKRVLQDVIRTMYNPKFITELFRSQEVYTVHSTRQIFDRLAHSSIMRLNESSMDKLFDLMTMGFKYQLVACSYPQQLLQVTMNHLHELRSKVEDAKPVCDLVDQVIASTKERYMRMTTAEFAYLKQALCRFFAEKRIKVSLFLQDGIQKNDGTITLSCKGPLPPGVEEPGKITYFDRSGSARGVDSFNFPAKHEVDLSGKEVSRLGLNLYARDKAASQPAAAAVPASSAASGAAATPASPAKPAIDSNTAQQQILKGGNTEAAMKGLNVLADLIGGAAEATANDNFKLNLFPDTGMDASGGGGSVGPSGPPTIVIDIGSSALQASNKNLVGIMDEMRIAGSQAPAGGDDLLDLMDKA